LQTKFKDRSTYARGEHAKRKELFTSEPHYTSDKVHGKGAIHISST